MSYACKRFLSSLPYDELREIESAMDELWYFNPSHELLGHAQEILDGYHDDDDDIQEFIDTMMDAITQERKLELKRFKHL